MLAVDLEKERRVERQKVRNMMAWSNGHISAGRVEVVR